ncbi:MAG: hypothetical protein AAFR61_05480 [Bacteroidota bacterium]
MQNYVLYYPQGQVGYNHSSYLSAFDTLRLDISDGKELPLTSKDIIAHLLESALDKLDLDPVVDKNKLLAVLQQDSSLINRDYYTNRILQPRDFYQKIEGVCEIKVGLELLTPASSSDLLPKEIKTFLRTKVAACERITNPALNRSINVVEIFDCLSEDPAFIQELENLLAEFDKYFEIVQLGMEEANLYFEAGDFILPGIYKVIIDKILADYARHIQRNSHQKYIILCEGFADRNLVGPSGIPYGFEGRYTGPGQFLEVGSGIPIGERIRDNLQLSFARAFKGIEYAKRAFPIKEGSIEVKFQYTGHGAITTEPGDARLHRKIVFSLIEDEHD